MKVLRQLFFFLIAVMVVTAGLSMIMPTSQKLEKSITIDAPAAVIYKELIKLENFNKYSVWSQRDTSVKYTRTGTDGTVGATSSWTGDPAISGEGKIEIVSLQENKTVSHKLSFLKPKKGNAESLFTLNENNGATTVNWNFKLSTPRPWNIFNLFYSLDKNMGKDFEEGLSLLKKAIEATQGTASSTLYEVNTMNFPATTFAIVRQKIKWSYLSSFFAEHIPIVYQEAQNANSSPGTACGLIYEWDEKTQQADIAAAVPVASGTKINSPMVQSVNISASKAVFVNYTGGYDKLTDAYRSIDKYISDNKLTKKTPSIEEYVTGPSNEKDTSKWLTKIVFLVE
ncbi:MAG: hypothetical protein HOP10_01835 [Chitinophagaceae bacterium]|nr:hypothetical protein [Chitinophagaceae bacterium]